MELTPKQLIEKFTFLKKYKDQEWFSKQLLKNNLNKKELPLKCALELISHTIQFIEQTKFNSRWEEGFSLKIRLKQIEDLLIYFCIFAEVEKTKKGTNLHHEFPIHSLTMQ